MQEKVLVIQEVLIQSLAREVPGSGTAIKYLKELSEALIEYEECLDMSEIKINNYNDECG
jgi:hypothetical protein